MDKISTKTIVTKGRESMNSPSFLDNECCPLTWRLGYMHALVITASGGPTRGLYQVAVW